MELFEYSLQLLADYLSLSFSYKKLLSLANECWYKFPKKLQKTHSFGIYKTINL